MAPAKVPQRDISPEGGSGDRQLPPVMTDIAQTDPVQDVKTGLLSDEVEDMTKEFGRKFRDWGYPVPLVLQNYYRCQMFLDFSIEFFKGCLPVKKIV